MFFLDIWYWGSESDAKELRFPVCTCSAQETGLWPSELPAQGYGYTLKTLRPPGCGYLALNRLMKEAGKRQMWI